MRVYLTAALTIFATTCAWAEPLSPELQKATDCMLQVLKTTRGISEAKLNTDKDSVCLEYQPNKEVLGNEVTSFCLDSVLHSSQTPPYSFTALFSGMVASPTEQPDFRIGEAVSRKWRYQCDVDALLILA